MTQECIVSLHEKGFYMVDIFNDGSAEGLSPDGYFTGSYTDTREDVTAKARAKYPDAKIIDGISGCCEECDEEYFENESVCVECGANVCE